MLTVAAVFTSIYLKRLGISILFFAFCPDMAQLPSIMADLIMLIFKDSVCHVVILSDIFFVCAGLPFLMVLELDIAPDPVLLQLHQVLFTAVAAVGSNLLQCISECSLMLFQNRDQCVIVRPVAAHITVDNEVILYRDLDIVCRL